MSKKSSSNDQKTVQSLYCIANLGGLCLHGGSAQHVLAAGLSPLSCPSCSAQLPSLPYAAMLSPESVLN